MVRKKLKYVGSAVCTPLKNEHLNLAAIKLFNLLVRKLVLVNNSLLF